jgi:hypothetical protein
MPLKHKLEETWKCPNGDVWTVYLVEYDSTTTRGGRDIVIQVKMNGVEVGHVTEHYDASGKLLKINRHPPGFNPNKAVPSDCKRVR